MTTPQLLTCASPSEKHSDRLTIEHLAALARIRLTADEQAAVAEHLHRMLSYIEKLREVNTEGIEPMAHAVDIVTSLRGDEVHQYAKHRSAIADCSGAYSRFLCRITDH